MEDANPGNSTISTGGFDEAKAGFYASIGLGAAVLAYAIYFVTFELTAESDLSYLLLGGMLGVVAVSCIGFHEWKMRQEGRGREQSMVEDYVAGTAVLCGSLAAVWLARYSAYATKQYTSYEGQIIEGQWAPTVELALVQTIGILLVMEISTNLIHRHNLGTLPRTVVVLAPISLSLSAITIWVDYAGGSFDHWNTASHVLLLGGAMVHSLRLDRSLLYLISAGTSMAVPALVALNLGVESGGWMVLMVVLVGMTATDRGLKREMIEQSSGFVIFGILVMQFVAASSSAEFQIGSFKITDQPFGLTFWLWAAMLVGWFAPTTMQRTPAMPIGLALALALLEAEAAMIAWSVGIGAFVYLETRKHARDWVVRSTYWAMVAAWTVSAFIADQEGGVFIQVGGSSFSNAFVLGLILLPILVLLGIWSESRGRFASREGSSSSILAGAMIPLADQSGWSLVILILLVAFAQIRKADQDLGRDKASGWALTSLVALLVAVSVLSIRDRGEVPLELSGANLLPLLFGVMVYIDDRIRKWEENTLLASPIGISSLLLVLASMICLPDDIADQSLILYRLVIAHIAIAGVILVMECGGKGQVSPATRLAGATTMTIFAVVSWSIFNSNPDSQVVGLVERIARDISVVAPLIVVDRLLRQIDDLSEQARRLGAWTLIALLVIGGTDVSGGLLSLPVFAIVAYRATTHVNTAILAILPIAGIFYGNLLTGSDLPSENIVLLLEAVPYISKITDFGPRWISIFMIAQVAFSVYAIRTEDRPMGETRWGPEQRVTIGIAGILAFAYIIPDFRVAWIFIAMALTGYSWRTGVVQWFNVAPLAFVWGIGNLFDWMDEGGHYISLNWADLFAWSCLIGASISGAQIILLRTGFLTRFYSAEDHESRDDTSFFSTDLSDVVDPLTVIALTSRGWMYLLLFLSADIGFSTWVVSSLLMTIDGLASGRRVLLYLGIVLQTVAWPAMASEDLLWTESQTSTTLLIPITQCLALIYMAWKGSDLVGRISFSEHGDEISKYASAMSFLVGYVYSFEGSALVFPLLVLGVSGHHSLVGFSMDRAWRRGFGLIGIPTGFLVAVPPDAGLLFPVMLFAAALSLIGQAVLYASRGGMGIGTAKEGGGAVIETIGLRRDSEETEETEFEADDRGDDLEEEGQGTDDLGSSENSPSEEEAERDQLKIEAVDMSEASIIEEDDAANVPQAVKIGEGKYSLDGSSLSVLLHPEVIRSIRSSIPPNTDGGRWKPVLTVDPNGAMNVHWEPVE